MARYGLREVANVTFYDYNTGMPALYLDTLKMSDLTIAAKSVDAVGGQGANRLLTWDYSRTATLDVQDALLNPSAMAALTGASATVGTQNIRRRECVTAVAAVSPATGVVLNVDYAPVAGSVIAFTTDDGYDQTAQIPANDITVTGTAIAVAVDETVPVNAGDQVIVYYQWASGSNTSLMEITAADFPGFYTVVGDTLVRNDTTGEDDPYQIIVTKAKLTPGFKLTLEAESNAPTVFDFKLEAYKPSDNDVMVQFLLIDDSNDA